MKRKRGQKKGSLKKPHVMNTNEEASSDVVSLSSEDDSCLNGAASVGLDRTVEAETPSPEMSDQPDKYASVNSDGLGGKTVEKPTYGRVKVKLKASKSLESRPTSDAPTQSVTDKSSHLVGLGKQATAEKMEDSANSLNDLEIAASGVSSMKAGCIMIKSPKDFSTSSINHTSNEKPLQGDSTFPNEISLPKQDRYYNKAELEAAHVVIKKVMKMDAAEPFNVPVNPIEIPDYFDVIDTPMDFGTICSNLENSSKYMNSKDVYKDVQYVWGNCYKYNNKGDYILELMKRVKKNFTKYWTAAQLYREHSSRAGGFQEDAAATHGQGKLGQSKNKAKKRHGFKRHKENCLCAICIMKRRRLEREQSTRIEDPIPSGDANLVPDLKQEVMCIEGSPCNEDLSSNMENSDSDGDIDETGDEAKAEDRKVQFSDEPEEAKEKRMVIEVRGDEIGDKSVKESTPMSQPDVHEDSSVGLQTNTGDEVKMLHKVEETESVQQQKQKEWSEKHQRARALEELSRYENPMLLKIGATLFTDDPQSVWRGPHSLVQYQRSAMKNSIDAAIATFMK